MSHSWNLSPKEAVALQKKLKEQILIQPLERKIHLISGVDLSYEIGGKELWAAFVLMRPEDLQPIAYAGIQDEMRFPYVPGLLSFREIPGLMKAWELLERKPDLILTDGHGIAHPRRMGIACHLGLLTQTPAMGCGKNVLTGKHAPLSPEKGSYESMVDKEEIVGYALRTRDKVKPMYISPGHLISLEESRTWALQTVGKYRMPEPTRQAHLLVNALRRGEKPLGWHVISD